MNVSIDTIAEFIWGFGSEFFLITPEGNFVWSDPDYGGDHTICPTTLTYEEWVDPNNLGLFGRAKGVHRIGDYCGNDVTFLKGE